MTQIYTLHIDNKEVPMAFGNSGVKYYSSEAGKNSAENVCFDNMICESKEIKEAINIARKVAQTDVPVILLGETGVGKELFAQSIHNESKRKKSPFIPINCSIIRKDLLEEKMFGSNADPFSNKENRKGLLEEADKGTVFLKEIGETELSIQNTLLGILETKSFIKAGGNLATKIDVRFISSTSRIPEQLIGSNNFRRDLFFRIGVVKIEIPPLRNRKEDIEPLAHLFIRDLSAKMKREINKTEKDFVDKLTRYSFPGNIRELRNVIERAIIMTEGDILKSSALPKEFFRQEVLTSSNNSLTLNEIEKSYILKVLRQAKGNKTKTAEILGIGLTTLYRKLQAYRIEL